ncbi:hypothetical protein HAX54_049516, partial [Datura stramonium]|nr:hypothetical protein [Datura stramonium]
MGRRGWFPTSASLEKWGEGRGVSAAVWTCREGEKEEDERLAVDKGEVVRGFGCLHAV